MRKSSLALAFVVLTSACATDLVPSRSVQAQITDPATAAAEIRALEAGWSRAFLAGDYAFLERIVAPEFVLAASFNGLTDFTARNEWMANTRKFQFREYETSVRNVMVVGDTAVATVDGRWLVFVPGFEKPRDDHFYVTDTWARRNGQWQVIFRHSGPPTTRRSASAEDPRAAVEAASNAWTEAIRRKDLAALATLMAPEFTLTDGDAKDPFPIKPWLANLQKMQVDHYETRITDVRTYGNIAVATVDGHWNVLFEGKRINEPFLLADFWVQRDGRWQIFRRHRIR